MFIIQWMTQAGETLTLTRDSWIDACAVMKSALDMGATGVGVSLNAQSRD